MCRCQALSSQQRCLGQHEESITGELRLAFVLKGAGIGPCYEALNVPSTLVESGL